MPKPAGTRVRGSRLRVWYQPDLTHRAIPCRLVLASVILSVKRHRHDRVVQEVIFRTRRGTKFVSIVSGGDQELQFILKNIRSEFTGRDACGLSSMLLPDPGSADWGGQAATLARRKLSRESFISCFHKTRIETIHRTNSDPGIENSGSRIFTNDSNPLRLPSGIPVEIERHFDAGRRVIPRWFLRWYTCRRLAQACQSSDLERRHQKA